MNKLPHPLPYQGSKRGLAEHIAPYVSESIDVWYEPFAGSAAMSLWVAAKRAPRKIVLGDSLDSLADLWRLIIDRPQTVARSYRQVWSGQSTRGPEYFNEVRYRFNQSHHPIDLLYLCCRCVKNAVRFNARGDFTQSVDKRRLGMAPDKMEAAVSSASVLLRGKTEVRSGDWRLTLSDAGPNDFVYMDPPYAGTSSGRDKRYAEWMTRERLIEGLKDLNQRDVLPSFVRWSVRG